MAQKEWQASSTLMCDDDSEEARQLKIGGSYFGLQKRMFGDGTWQGLLGVSLV